MAKADLPDLVRRLIWASCPDLVFVDVPGGEAIYLRGYDGIVEASMGNRFVPEGTSAWELSTESDVTGKANEDYNKRTNDPLNIDPVDTAFVFLTSRRWNQIREWIDAKSVGPWREVRAIDAGQLADWIDHVPWIADEFAYEVLRRPRTGICGLRRIWDNYRHVPIRHGTLSSDFIIANRTNTAREILPHTPEIKTT